MIQDNAVSVGVRITRGTKDMSKYIDAEALDFGALSIDGICQGLAEEIIAEAPSIDIVFCKECKKANTEDCSHSYWDDDWGEWRVGYRGDEWFCADGEREGE